MKLKQQKKPRQESQIIDQVSWDDDRKTIGKTGVPQKSLVL